MPDVREEVENYCPFGCSDEELDELGMCVHVVGFCTVDPNKPSERKVLEPLEAAVRKRKNPDTGEIEEVETGFLLVNGKKREYVQDSDKLVNPLTPQKDYQSGQTHDHWKWFSWRVYSERPNSRTPELVPTPKRERKAKPKRKEKVES
jgi:hypothetical protein